MIVVIIIGCTGAHPLHDKIWRRDFEGFCNLNKILIIITLCRKSQSESTKIIKSTNSRTQ